MGHVKSIRDLDIVGRRVLMRVDFNVPLTSDGRIADDSRIVAALPSIRHVIEEQGALVLMSHLGRPKGKVVDALSLRPCSERLSQLLGGHPVDLLGGCRGEQVRRRCHQLTSGEIVMLENLRFEPAEEAPREDPEFVHELALCGDLYVNDAFGTAHRFHASTAAVASHFPGCSAAGFLMEKELEALKPLVTAPERPFCAIVGGAKVSSKIGVLRALSSRVDTLLIGGGMAYTFFKARGIDVGDSLVEMDVLDEALSLLAELEKNGVRYLLPCDHLITNEISPDADVHIVAVDEGVPSGMRGVDIGPATIQEYAHILRDAKTVLWNGPMGIFECDRFSTGTKAVARLLAELSDATTIVGGGDSLAAIHQAGVADGITHLSTGGGASLEYIEKGQLPGLEALEQAEAAAASLPSFTE